MNTFKRLLAAVFGAVLFLIISPIAYYFIFKEFPFGGLREIALVLGGGAAFGAILGAMFPRVFGFIFEAFLGN